MPLKNQECLLFLVGPSVYDSVYFDEFVDSGVELAVRRLDRLAHVVVLETPIQGHRVGVENQTCDREVGCRN